MKQRRLFCIAALAAVGVLLTECGKFAPEEITVLIRMMPGQERFFREQLIPAFEKEHNCKISIATFNSEWDIERILKLESSKKNPSIALVKTPFEMTRPLVKKELVKDLYSVMDSDQVLHDIAEYHQLASGMSFFEGKPYYIPRKLETRMLFYRKSMVAEAVAKFPNHRTRINRELKTVNGFGIPAGYELEGDPGKWNFYDLYVIGSIWANEEYNGVKMGRIAHRGARYGGTALFLVDQALQLGASTNDVLKLTEDKMVEMFVWERAFIRNGIYNQGMWQDPWKGANIYNAIKDGKVFAAHVQQIDAFLIHGWKDDPSMPSYLPEEGDMGLAVVPQAVSFELDSAGKPFFEGTRSISTGGWWWGIPKTSPDAKLAYALARFITSRENQAKECSRFGMIPVRKDILNKLPEVFDQGWVGGIFKTAVAQVQQNGLTTVPLVAAYSEMSQNLIDAWYALCIEYKET
ncbi:MAG: carbohydrate ABC transporter substrate-binding protein, partial [Chitinispirillaceae bacterium]|nr:carbohydrate ABC transporter substrate-binding protein [Chitinispirillaceae bacterium]